MNNDQRKINKLRQEVRALQNELNAVKSSRSYKFAITGSVLKSKASKEPISFPLRIAKTLINDPSKIIRLAKGKQLNPSVADSINNRIANYERWIRNNEPDDATLRDQRVDSGKLKYKPTISILTPVFDPPVDVLEELINSVTAQTYPYFELCLGNFGKSIEIKKLLSDYSDKDDRVKVYEFEKNEGISGNSNALLKKVQGEYIGLLDHDDTLSPDALYENVKLLNKSKYDMIFSDKDMMDDKGNRYEPLLKPDLSPETMLSANYLTHFDIMNVEIVNRVGGWDSKSDGAQDWDLFLKIMLETEKIAHLPKILYHWRVISTSTAHSIQTKPYALAGQRYAVQKYLDAKKIKATPYHHDTELILKWDPSAIDSSPLVFINSHSISNTLRLLSQLRKTFPGSSRLIIVHQGDIDEKTESLLRHQGASDFCLYNRGKLARALNDFVVDVAHSMNGSKTTVFLDDRVEIPKKFSYNDMTGWLSINGVGAVGGKILNKDQEVADSGSVLTSSGIKPLFHNCPEYYQSYLGNIEWVRNLKVVSLPMFAVRTDVLRSILFGENLSDKAVFAGLMINMSKNHRLVAQPKSVAYADYNPFDELKDTNLDNLIKVVLSTEPVSGVDRYSNPNVSEHDPMHLNNGDVVGEAEETVLDRYQHDALILSRTFDLSKKELELNTGREQESISEPKTVGWFLPSFDGIYAGLNNIFSFANYLAVDQKLKTHFFILKSDKVTEEERNLVVDKFPLLASAEFVAIDGKDLSEVPKLDIGICTQWATAYPLARCKDITRKCYFIQDNETNFYPKGSISSLVELTYKLNFFALANTPGLLDLYKSKYGGKGTVVKSLVDLSIYSPKKTLNISPKKPYKVFFYGRPNMPRNAFEIGIAGLTELKYRLGDNVKIVSAGADWGPSAYGVSDVLENLGKIPYSEIPDFYRSIDTGMMFMFSGHPGVVASELMASGVPVVVNEYDDITWRELYRHRETCLVTPPTASLIADALEQSLTDSKLRKSVINGGLKITSQYYKGYEDSLHQAFKAMKEKY